MSTSLITLSGQSVALSNDAAIMRESALEKAALVGLVKTASDNERAAGAMLEVRRVLKLVESARKEVKEPVLDLCRAIDAAAKEFCHDLACEEIRLARATGNYQQEQLEIQRAAARRAAEEAARIERERLEAQRKIEEEQRRIAEEARLKALAEMAAAKSEADKASAELRAKQEQERIAAEAEAKAKIEAERAAQQLQAVAPPPVHNKAEGQTVREVWRHEVTNIFDVVRARPDLCDITIRKSSVNELVALLVANGTEPKVPGLRFWKETVAGVRVGREQKVIEV